MKAGLEQTIYDDKAILDSDNIGTITEREACFCLCKLFDQEADKVAMQLLKDNNIFRYSSDLEIIKSIRGESCFNQ